MLATARQGFTDLFLSTEAGLSAEASARMFPMRQRISRTPWSGNAGRGCRSSTGISA
jgi:hypothetical protein